MSENNNLPNEQELWDLLSEPVATEPKSEKAPKPKVPKSEGRFLKPDAEPPVKPEPAQPSAPRKIDGFFLACMAGVAAVSVAATLVIGGMVGGEKTPGPVAKDPIQTSTPVGTENGSAELLAALELENAELRAQLELQKQQITDLQSKLIDLQGSEQYLATVPTGEGSGEGSTVMDDQLEAYDIFNQIKAAYADFDRAKLEELIPQMDKRLSYLSSDALNEYYLILEYVEQPSNG